MKKEKIFEIMVEMYKHDLEWQIPKAIKSMKSEGVNSWEFEVDRDATPENYTKKDEEYARGISLIALRQAVEETIKKNGRRYGSKIECLEIRIRYSRFNNGEYYLYHDYIVIKKEL